MRSPREQAHREQLALLLPVSLSGGFSLSLCVFPFEGDLIVGQTPTAAPKWGLWLRRKPSHTLTEG